MHNETKLGTKPGTRTSSHETDGKREARPNRGETVSGPAFYVWEEDPRQARQWGAELADAWRSQHRGTRS